MTGLVVILDYQFETYRSGTVRRERMRGEMLILVCSYIFLAFNVVSVEDNYTIGYVSIGLVFIYIAVGILVMLARSILTLRARIKVWLTMRRYKQSRIEL